MREQTRIVKGTGNDEVSGCIDIPIYRGVVYAHDTLEFDHNRSYYARCGTPTTKLVEENIAFLEKGDKALLTSSGMGAISVVLKLFKPGDHIIVTADLYGGSYRYFKEFYADYGIEFDFVDTWDIEEVKKHIKKETKGFFIETPSNPAMHVTDLRAIGTLAKANNAYFIVDNTLLSPYFQKPLTLGADIVVHSATKYLGGHNDLLAGVIVIKGEELIEKLYFAYISEGNNISAEDAWLLNRSLKTLPVRVERQQANAIEIVKFLKTLPEVDKVYYVGDEERDDYELSKSQTTGFGGMISFSVKHKERIKEYLPKFKVINFAESLGGVESLITYPYLTTQEPIPEDLRKHTGADESLLRLSIGLEDVEDLKEDLAQALS